jgi:hypothetical protein
LPLTLPHAAGDEIKAIIAHVRWVQTRFRLPYAMPMLACDHPDHPLAADLHGFK